MPVTYVRYEAEGWGIGELVFADGLLVHSELPRPLSRSGGGRATASAPWPAPSSLRRRRPPEGEHPLVERLQRYFAGERVDFRDVEVELGDRTPFAQRLADAMRAIPYGEVVTYGELALAAGRARAARAAGNFCAGCALAPILPVHRVVSVSGIGGWGPRGTEYKRRLLELEGFRGAL